TLHRNLERRAVDEFVSLSGLADLVAVEGDDRLDRDPARLVGQDYSSLAASAGSALMSTPLRVPRATSADESSPRRILVRPQIIVERAPLRQGATTGSGAVVNTCSNALISSRVSVAATNGMW